MGDAVLRHSARVARVAALVLAVGMLLFPEHSLGSGFQLNEQSARLLGTGLAGTAALAEDATTGFFNPAGMTLLPNGGIAGTVAWVHLDNTLEGISASTIGQPNVTGPNGSRAVNDVENAYVPSFHLVQKVHPDWAIGIGATSPWGLKTNYPDDSIVRYVGTLSSLEVINLNANVAWQATEQMSFGIGFNAGHAKAHLNQNVSLNPTEPDGHALLFGQDWSYGWNVGLLFQAPRGSVMEGSRVGIAYRSAIAYTLEGQSDYINQAEQHLTGPVTAGLTTPGFFTISGLWQINPEWQLLGDFQLTQWSRFQNVSIDVVSLGLPSPVLLDLGFRDAMRGSVGGRWKPDDHWSVSLGVGYDQSPVTGATRTVRLPDGNRVLLGAGAGYRLWDQIYVDVAYMHVFVADGDIDFVSENLDASWFHGTSESAVDLVALQFTYNWDEFPPNPFKNFGS